MKYYDSEDIDVLTMPMSYILDNFYDLFESVTKLSDKNILIQDLHDGNVITNKNQIIVIDADMYDIFSGCSSLKKEKIQVKMRQYVLIIKNYVIYLEIYLLMLYPHIILNCLMSD